MRTLRARLSYDSLEALEAALNEYAGQFSEQFQQLELLYDETCSIISWDLTEADEHLHDRWLQEFCIQVPDKEIRKQLEQIIKQQYQEQGMEDPTETDIV